MAALIPLLVAGAVSAADGATFAQSSERVDTFDYVEVTAIFAANAGGNPFLDSALIGQFGRQGEPPVAVDGFCDAQDGSVFRARFMPRLAGVYTYVVTLRSGATETRHQGSFLFRNEAWTNTMGAFLKSCDPYDHLTSVHGHGEFPFRTSEWADFAMHQSWDEGGGYAFVRACRDQQAKTGRPMPQVNEEYGYEDHYPTWGGNRKAPARSADNRRRLAWGMVMAGGYQTTGERADTGTGWRPDTGGGWINGRGDGSMVMLKGYAHLVDFFTAMPWWTLEPDDGLVAFREESPVRTALTH